MLTQAIPSPMSEWKVKYAVPGAEEYPALLVDTAHMVRPFPNFLRKRDADRNAVTVFWTACGRPLLRSKNPWCDNRV